MNPNHNRQKIYKYVASKQIEIGRKLQLDHPEIVDLWRDTRIRRKDIVKKLDIKNEYDIPSQEIAEGVVYRALQGYDGRFTFTDFPAYPALMSEGELLSILLQRRIANGRNRGSKLLNDNQGLYSQTEEEWIENSRKGGNASYEKKAGIFKQSEEEWAEIYRKGGIASAKSRGLTPYSHEEIAYIFNLAEHKDYQRIRKVNNAKIAKEVNEKFHNSLEVRTGRSIAVQRYNIKKKYETIDNFLEKYDLG